MHNHVGIDVGKTGLRVAVFDIDLTLVERWSYPTADVDRARDALAIQLWKFRRKYDITSVGISIFGPLQVQCSQPDYGAIIESSEPAWSGVNIPEQVASTLKQDVFFDFDVNAGALAEAVVGAARERSRFVYLSVGTGIGAVHVRGSHVAGYAPQLGHMYIPREKDDLAFAGSCRFHGDCLQGLASGRAIAQRWGLLAESIEPGHPAWDLEGRYIARACANLIYAFSPEVILLGSSVGSSPNLRLPDVNRHLRSMLNNFLEPELRGIYALMPAAITASLGTDCSLVGAALLGREKCGLRICAAPLKREQSKDETRIDSEGK